MSEEQNQTTQPGTEFEREPVPQKALLGFKSFIGMYAGEHCAGTELMLGPLFVAAGVSAFDLIVGLILGNALATLSWTLMEILGLFLRALWASSAILSNVERVPSSLGSSPVDISAIPSRLMKKL